MAVNGSVTLAHALMETAQELHSVGQWSLATQHFRLALGLSGRAQRRQARVSAGIHVDHERSYATIQPGVKEPSSSGFGTEGWRRVVGGPAEVANGSVTQLVFIAVHAANSSSEHALVNNYVDQLESDEASRLWVLLFTPDETEPAAAGLRAPVFAWSERALHAEFPALATVLGKSLRILAKEPVQNHARYYYFHASLVLWLRKCGHFYPRLQYIWRLEPDVVFTGSLPALLSMTAATEADVLLPALLNQQQTFNLFPHWAINRAALKEVPLKKRVWSLVSLGRYSVWFIANVLARSWGERGYVLYEEIGLPVICLTTPGCRLADLRETALGKRVRFKPEWPCESVLQSRERCWQELWHPVKARDCLLSDRSQAALRACAKAPRRKRNARGLPHIYGVGSA